MNSYIESAAMDPMGPHDIIFVYSKHVEGILRLVKKVRTNSNK